MSSSPLVIASHSPAELCSELLLNDNNALDNLDAQRRRAIRHWAALVINISALQIVRSMLRVYDIFILCLLTELWAQAL